MTSAEGGGVVHEDNANTFREAREYSLDHLDVDHHDVHPVAGLIEDDDTRELLSFMSEVYDHTDENGDPIEGMPRSFWETPFAREVVRKHATDLLTNAIDEGNLTQTAFLTGLPSYKSDVSGMQAINKLSDWLNHSENCKLIYMAALMGRGKTDLAVTFFEIIHDHYQRIRSALKEHGLDHLVAELPEPEFAANFEVEPRADLDVEIKEIRDERALLDWAEGGSSDEVRWFIFDEASTALTAQSGENAQKVAENMAPFVKRMRKLGVNMIVIGHDKGDVHVAIRSLADFVGKDSLKTASFYAGINKREPVGHLFDIEGIPPTEWDFNTDDMAEWAWMDDEERAARNGEDVEDDVDVEEVIREYRNERIVNLRTLTDEEGDPLLAQGDVAKAFDISQSMVSTIEKRVEAAQNDTQSGGQPA